MCVHSRCIQLVLCVLEHNCVNDSSCASMYVCREMAVKFNDYFEFPREFDMAPYTAAHLAKVEGQSRPALFILLSTITYFCPTPTPPPSGEVIEEDNESENTKSEDSPECTAYSLRGIVVHSGQASGGHYYSFIRYRWAGQDRDTYTTHLPHPPVPPTCPPHLSSSSVLLICPPHLSSSPVPSTCHTHLSHPPVPSTCHTHLSHPPATPTCHTHLPHPPATPTCHTHLCVCVCVCVCVFLSVCSRPPGSGTYKWYKFDDSEVTEWKMDDDEVLVCHCHL